MNTKKILLLTGLSVALFSSPFTMNTESALAYNLSGKPAVQINKIAPLSEEKVVSLAAQWASTSSYIQRGGDYKEGEYKTFTYKGRTYRYLSSDIDTKKELYHYIRKTLTPKETAEWFKNTEIIEYKGKMAQLEADGGSILDWKKATAEYVKTEKKTKFYRLFIPIGETGKKEMQIIGIEQERTKWKVAKMPYLDLDIPGNINPAFIFFNFLLKDDTTSQNQLIVEDFDLKEFKKGVKKVEIKNLEEVARNAAQVEYSVTFHTDLEKGYKGCLKNGLNKMYFLIQQTDEMEFKVVSLGFQPHIVEE